MKKVIIIFVNNSMAELDWIMPVIQKLSKKYYIFTYFRNKKTFETLQMNRQLFSLWNEVNNSYFIENIFNNFFYKLSRKILYFFQIKIFDKFLNYKIHSTSFFKKTIYRKLNNKNFNVEIIFSDFGESFSALKNLKLINDKKKKKPLIVHYPHTATAYEEKKNKFPVNLQGDILLLNRKRDIHYFKDYIDNSKIRISGIPKYDEWWIKKILKDKSNIFDLDYSVKNLKKKLVITIGYYSRFDVPGLRNKEHLFKNQLIELMNVVSKIPNAFIIFKLHPRRNSLIFKKILDKYNKKIWQISKMHLIKLNNLSNCFINSVESSACYDSLCLKIPTLQIWRIKGVEPKNGYLTKLGLVKNLKNVNELTKYLTLSLNKNHNLWKLQQRNFKNNCPYLGAATKKTLDIINQEIKRIC